MASRLGWLSVAAYWVVGAAQNVDVSTAVQWTFPLAHDLERQQAYAEALETVVGNCVRQGTGPHAIVVLDAGLGQLATVALRSQSAAFVGVFVPHEPALAHAVTATLQAATDIHPSRYLVATSPPDLLNALEALNVSSLCAVATDFMPKSVQHSRSHLAVVGGLIQAGFVDPANTALVPHAMCVTAHLLHAPHVNRLTTIDPGSTAGVDMTAAFPVTGAGSSVPPPTFWAEHRPLSVRQLAGGGAVTLLTLNGTGTGASAAGAGEAGASGCDAQWRLIDMASVRLPQAGTTVGGKPSAPKPLTVEVPRKAVASGLAHAVVWWPGFLFQTRPPPTSVQPASSSVDEDVEESATVSVDAAGNAAAKQVKRRKRRAQRAYRLLQTSAPPLSPLAPLSPHSPHWEDVVLPLLPEPAWITAGGRSSIEVSFGPQLIVSARLASVGNRKFEDLAAASKQASSGGGGRGAVFPTWHISMLNDAPRNDAYAAGIRSAVRAAQAAADVVQAGGSVHVLELGAGAGLLSVLAAKAGNGSLPQQHHRAAVDVAAVEANPSMLNRLRATVRANGVGAAVTVIPKHSTDLNVCHAALGRTSGAAASSSDCDLRQPVDVIVHEVFDFTVTGEGVVPSVHDALTRLTVGAAAEGVQRLTPVVVPAAVVVYGVLVESEDLAHLYGPPLAPVPPPSSSSSSLSSPTASASSASAEPTGLAATAASWLQSLSSSIESSFSSSTTIRQPPTTATPSSAAASSSSPTLAGASVLPWTTVQHPVDLNTLRHAFLHDPVPLWSLDFTDPTSLEPLLPPGRHSSSSSPPTQRRSVAPPVAVRVSRGGAPHALVTWFSLGFADSADGPLAFTYSTSPQAMPTADHWYQAATLLEDFAPLAVGETVTLTPTVSPHGAGGFPSVVVSVSRGLPAA